MKAILDYWFGEIREDAAYLEERNKLWFGKDAVVDSHLRETFLQDVTSAAAGGLTEWEHAPATRLALILLLDQFSRNVFRDSPQAFAQDPRALGLSLSGIDNGMDRLLHPVQRIFFYLPLEHSEDLRSQQRSLACFTGLVRDAPGPLKEGWAAPATTPCVITRSSRVSGGFRTATRSWDVLRLPRSWSF